MGASFSAIAVRLASGTASKRMVAPHALIAACAAAMTLSIAAVIFTDFQLQRCCFDVLSGSTSLDTSLFTAAVVGTSVWKTYIMLI